MISPNCSSSLDQSRLWRLDFMLVLMGVYLKMPEILEQKTLTVLIETNKIKKEHYLTQDNKILNSIF